jgi:Zn-dependent peptidase ImmA (M78 family)
MRQHGLPADRARSYDGLERVAAYVRSVLKWDTWERMPSGVRVFESLREWSVTVPGRGKVGVRVRVGASLPYEAFTLYDKDRQEFVVVVDEKTYEGLERDRHHDRFTIAHEVGHLVLHGVELVRLSAIHHTQAALMRGKVPSHPAYMDTEWQANGFAAALLMPAPGLLKIENNPTVLHEEGFTQQWFGVSEESATYRWLTFRNRKAALLRAAEEGMSRK